MRNKWIACSLIVATSSTMLLARTSIPSTREWDGSESSDWNEADNWTPPGVPGSADSVVIPDVTDLANAPAVNVNARVKSLTIEDGGTLETRTNTIEISGASGLVIESGGELTVDQAGTVEISGGGSDHTIDGLLTLSVAGSSFALTSTQAIRLRTAVGGAGAIRGLHNSARVFIAPAFTFNCGVAVEGGLMIETAVGGLAPGTFNNENLVHSNTGLTIELHDATVVDDIAGATWKASGADSILRFSADGPLLRGAFTIEDDARFEFEETIMTSGDFEAGAGENVIEVASGERFLVDRAASAEESNASSEAALVAAITAWAAEQSTESPHARTTREWDGNVSANWDEPDNWTPSGVPGPSDTAVIPDVAGLSNAPVLNVNADVHALTIENGGTLETDTFTIDISGSSGLNIQIGGAVTVEQSGTVILTGGGVGHRIDGLLQLEAAGSMFAIDEENATVDGNGRVLGLHKDATIMIKPPTATYQLRCRVAVEGQLFIHAPSDPKQAAPGAFRNEKLVHSNSGRTIELRPPLTALDTQNATWKASRDEAPAFGTSVLWFRSGGAITGGDFIVQDGSRLEFDVSVTTNGGFEVGPGENVIDVASGKTFRVE